MQEGEIEPLGSNRIVSFDVRIIAATSRDLAALVREGRFREDLFYRLNVLPLRLPPLRERRQDIPALLEVLAEDLAQRNQVAVPELSRAALELMCAQTWRGNIRELRNVLEQAAMRSDSATVEAELVAQVLRESGVEQLITPLPAIAPLVTPDPGALLRPLDQQVRELEREAISCALDHCHGNKQAAARLLGISRATLYQRLDLSEN